MAKRKCRMVAMIPARMGSTRLAMKNLALIGGRPMIYYAIKAAKDSGAFDRVVINSEDSVFAKIAKRYGVEFYRRPGEWATSTAKSDFVVYDFIKNNPCDIVAWVNPTSPLQTAGEVRGAMEYFKKEKLDSMITVKDEQVHCVYKGKPVNFNLKEVFAQTQDLVPVQPFVYSVMAWRTGKFMREFEKKGYSFFCGKTGNYPVSKLAGIIIKRQEDLMAADLILRSISKKDGYRLRYDKLAVKGRRG
ncbi:MAG: hypothetical protein WC369_03565 [Dehalococcoidales bacterium]